MVREDDYESRRTALSLAVKHHGMANSAPNAVPCRANTVIETAVKFERYLLNGHEHDTREP